jgi:hypothetical protein
MLFVSYIIYFFDSQNLDNVDNYARSQTAKATGINKIHYNDILRQIKIIRDRQTNIK